MDKEKTQEFNRRAEDYQRLMAQRDAAITKAIQLRNDNEPVLARLFYNAGQHYEAIARGL